MNLSNTTAFISRAKSATLGIAGAVIVSGGVLFPVASFAADIRPSGPAQPVSAPLEKARAAIERKDWAFAVRELNALVGKEPKNADAQSLLGYSLRKSGDLARSKVHYDEALKLDPDHRGAHEYIGELYLMLKQPENARKHLTELERVCGNKECEEYQDLAKALTAYKP
jgi:Flp pilus assembly protein TadD